MRNLYAPSLLRLLDTVSYNMVTYFQCGGASSEAFVLLALQLPYRGPWALSFLNASNRPLPDAHPVAPVDRSRRTDSHRTDA